MVVIIKFEVELINGSVIKGTKIISTKSRLILIDDLGEYNDVYETYQDDVIYVKHIGVSHEDLQNMIDNRDLECSDECEEDADDDVDPEESPNEVYNFSTPVNPTMYG